MQPIDVALLKRLSDCGQHADFNTKSRFVRQRRYWRYCCRFCIMNILNNNAMRPQVPLADGKLLAMSESLASTYRYVFAGTRLVFFVQVIAGTCRIHVV